jgi:putative SbcD/Mre11-related phosphoesterase
VPVEPIPDAPALLVDGETLVVADLHIGLEEELRIAGFFMPSQTGKMADRLLALAEGTDAKRLVVLGDVRHVVPTAGPMERRDVRRFFEGMTERFASVDIAPGNHDGLLRDFLPKDVRLRSVRGFVRGDVGFVHGHAWPSPKVMAVDTLLMGHNHPAVLFVDDLGGRQILPCWFRVPFRPDVARYERMPREGIVVPSFNELCGGSPVNDRGSDLLGPLLQPDVARLDEGRVHLLDGADLGRRKDLLVDGRWRMKDYRQ